MSEEEEPLEEGETTPIPKKGPVAWFARNRVASNVLMIVLILGGLAMLTRLKQEVFPEVSLERIVIQVPYPGASPEEVETGVTLALEEAVRGLEGVDEVTSTSGEGVSTVVVKLLTGAEQDRALNDVKAAVDRITSMPEDIERPVISLAVNQRQVISVVLYGDISESSLRELAEQTRDDLTSSSPKITLTDVSGVRPLEISVEASQDSLRANRITIGQIAEAIRGSSIDLPAGGIRTSAGEVLLRTAARRETGSEIEDIVIRSRPDGSELRVGDVATVTDGFREVDREASFNGQRAAMVNIYRIGEQSPIEVADAAKAWIQENAANLPPGVGVVTWNDASEIYAARIDLLLRNAFMGLALVLLVLGLFLEPRLAFWVTLGIPISFAGSLLFLPAADVSLNMISLFAFIVTLGMVVDDAIVVGESVYQMRQSGKSRLRAAVVGAKSVSVPVVFSILTTCVFFAPLLFIPGVSGKFFRNIPIVVISVLLISLAESLLVLPAHLSHPMPFWLRGLLAPLLYPLELLQKLKIHERLLTFIDKVFEPVLRKAIEWRYLTLATSVMIFMVVVVGSLAGGRMSFTPMPKIEGDVVSASLRMPVGTPFAQTRELADLMTRTAREVVEASGGEAILEGIFTEAGAGGTSGSGPTSRAGAAASHMANVRIQLVESDQRDVTTSELAEQWRALIGEIPGAENLNFRYSLGGSAGQPIDIRLSHSDSEVLEVAAQGLAETIGGIEGTRDVDSGVSLGKEQIDLNLTTEGRARGLTELMLARQIRNAYYGAEASRQQRGRDELRVYVRRPLAERESLSDVERLVVRTPDGGEMLLADAADIERGRAYTSITRINGRRVISVTGDIIDGVGNATEILASLQGDELPQLLAETGGLTYELGGEQKDWAETFAALKTGFGLAFFIVFGLLAIPFRSYAQPLLVLSAIPFGFVGAFLGHLFMEFDLSIISVMGMVALSGVVVNDSLILIVRVNEMREEGYSIWDSVIGGAKQRFRPILLTSLTTFFGLVPMILEPSVQARFLVPMAVSLAFGVIFATFVLLLLVPSLYLILEDIKNRMARPIAFVARNIGVAEAELPTATDLSFSPAGLQLEKVSKSG